MALAELSVGDVVTLRIRALAAGGAGVGDLPDGRVAFVHRTAPGDVVDARVTRLRPRWGQAELVQVAEAGPERVEALCPFYGECGGCTLQHVAYEEQVRWKRRFVADALDRIGGVEVELPQVVPSPDRLRYRNRVTFTVRKLAATRIVAGFHALERPERVVDVDHRCLLPEPAILDAWEALRGLWRKGLRPLPTGKELRLTLRALENGGVVLLVKGGAAGWDPSPLLARVPDFTSVWHQPGGEEAPTLVAGRPVHEVWGDDSVPVAGQAFLQVNRRAAAPLAAFVLAQAGPPGRCVDAYCGVGVYGRALARMGWKAVGIELDADACEGARHDAPPGFQVMEGRVEDHLPAALPADMVILNPPRTGLQEWIPGILLHHEPGKLVYVSCDPATLARDAGRLKERFDLTALRSFDLFPQTSHVETVAVFTLRSHRRGGA